MENITTLPVFVVGHTCVRNRQESMAGVGDGENANRRQINTKAQS